MTMHVCRFGLVPIMHRWMQQTSNNRVMNELGFAFLRRLTIDPPAPMANSFQISKHADVAREVDGTISTWNLLNPKHGRSDSMLLPTVRGPLSVHAVLKHPDVYKRASLCSMQETKPSCSAVLSRHAVEIATNSWATQ